MLLDGLDDGAEVQRAHARCEAVVVGDVDVVDAALALAEGAEDVAFLDVHVEQVQAHAAVRADRIGQGERLVAAVDEIGLEAVQRLDGDADAGLLGVRIDLLDAFDQPLPFLVGRAVGHHLADRGRHHRDDLAVELLGQRDHALHVVDGLLALRDVLGGEVALAQRQRDRAPALAAVVGQELAHFLRVVLVGLARDLERVDAGLAHALDRALDGFGAHPVVGGDVHGRLLCGGGVRSVAGCGRTAGRRSADVVARTRCAPAGSTRSASLPAPWRAAGGRRPRSPR